MNKKAYNTPKTEVTSVEIQSFIAASLKPDGTKGTFDSPEADGDANTALSDININDVWE